jgi:hypothetical protein
MTVVSADTSCYMIWWGTRAACAEVYTGSVEAKKATPGFKAIPLLRSHLAPEVFGRIVFIYINNIIIPYKHTRSHYPFSSTLQVHSQQ